ncbi:MAG TPA: malto-oligosyltrehalose synthase [Solirubrobacteraceae bacterium]|nr:malto-oligosyltrehalose synthase [Solirubrobacteraceae bacterium]
MSDLRATYRLQLGPGLRFDDVRALVPYLSELGVSHLYLSPSLTARSGSTHGYDVVDPTRVSDALGGEEALRELSRAGLRIILDIVPNHMGTGAENRWWADEAERLRVFDVDPETGHYRRFFDIDDLAGVRVEDPDVFDLTHAKVLELLRDGVIDGLRVDHPDGLADPAGYLERLAGAGAVRVWVEKILHPGERLRDWPVSGTVGYEFLNDVQGVFIDPAGEAPLTELLAELTGEQRSFDEVALEAQLEQARGTFSREVQRLARLHDPGGLEEALARLPVYRTYVRDGVFDDADRAALAAAGRPDLFDDAPEEFVSRFQQTSPPVTAKGIEDTAFYRYVRLLALNDVGGDPGRWGISVAQFHAANEERAQRFPEALLVTQTHDTKRSGDVRARIGALSGMAEAWSTCVRRWYELTDELVHDSGRAGPDGQERYLIFQTLVGAWPIGEDRLGAYIEKALREAKRNTNWVDQNTAWEEGVKRFATALLSHRPFLASFDPFAAEVAAAGERAALGQLLLKLTVPGVPDVYQGDELVDLSLVDPDNRRPVEWDARREALAALRGGAQPARETMKLHVISRALDLRARRPQAFGPGGAYTPIEAGPDVCAFTRGAGDVLVVVALRRSPARAQLHVPPGRYRDVLGSAEHDLAGPVAVGRLAEQHGLALLERL